MLVSIAFCKMLRSNAKPIGHQDKWLCKWEKKPICGR